MSESESTRQAWNVTPPTVSATPGEGVTVLTTTTTAAAVDLFDGSGVPYPGLFYRYLTITADGADVYFAFASANTPAIDPTAGNTAVGTGTTTGTCAILKDGVSISVRLDPNSHRYLHLKASSGTPKVRIYGSSQKRPL